MTKVKGHTRRHRIAYVALVMGVVAGTVIGQLGSGGFVAEAKAAKFVTADDGETVKITTTKGGGFEFLLRCATGTFVDIKNVSGGDESKFDSNDGSEQNDLDEGEAIEILGEGDPDENEEGSYVLFGTDPSFTQAGQIGLLNQPQTGFGGADCVAFVTAAK